MASKTKVKINKSGQWSLDKSSNIFEQHAGLMPKDHPDRPKMVNAINDMHRSGNTLEARRLYDKHISGGGAYTSGVAKDEEWKSQIDTEVKNKAKSPIWGDKPKAPKKPAFDSMVDSAVSTVDRYTGTKKEEGSLSKAQVQIKHDKAYDKFLDSDALKGKNGNDRYQAIQSWKKDYQKQNPDYKMVFGKEEPQLKTPPSPNSGAQKYHIHVEGNQITDKPLTRVEIENKHGPISKLETNGFKVIPHKTQ